MAFPDNDHDLFTNLSDDTVRDILSLLPTKMAYRTCILSKRWASICTSILDFHFVLPRLSDPLSSQEIQSVYAVFLRRETHVRKLRIESEYGCKPYHVHQWVLKALDLNVKELDLKLFLAKPVFLPLKLSTFELLVVLKLKGSIQPIFSYSSEVNFPSLKILHLDYLGFISFRFSLLPFLSGCPHLEEFFLRDVLNQPIKISFQMLKRLSLDLDRPSLGKTLQINVPSSVEALNIDDSTHIKYECIDFFNVDRATLCINKHPDFDSFYVLLNGISTVKSLTLTEKTIMFLSMENDLDKLNLPTFSNLLSLSVEISQNCNWNMLVSFLQNAPKLKNLVIEKNFKRNSSRKKEVEKLSWVVPPAIPTCLSRSLIRFVFKGIQNLKTEMDFTRYIINQSSNLETAKIFASSAMKTIKRSLHKESSKSLALVLDVNSL